MSISLKILSYHRHTPGQQEIFQAETDSFTIGRNDENDWAIPDPQRFLSGVHCRLHCESGRYYLTDVSTNGVFINGSESRMDRDSTLEVSHQDKFRIGDYEFEVLIDEADNSSSYDDEDPFDDSATMVGQGQSNDEFEDEYDDPFTDPVPQQSPGSRDRHDDFQKDINTPLQHIDSNPISNAVSIESLLDLDDLEDEEEDTAASLRERHNPLNDAFKASKHVSKPPESASSIEFESDFPSDIPDDWDEATGMLKIPDAPAQSESVDTENFDTDSFDADTVDTDDDLSDFSSAEAQTDEPATEEPITDKSIDLPDEWEDALDIFDDSNDQSPPPTPKPVESAAVTRTATDAPEITPDEVVAETPAKKEHRTEPARTASPATSSQTASALAAFIAGAGLKGEDLSGINEQVFFEQLGGMMAEFTTGLVQTLSGRTHIKSEFRLDQTMIRPVENNPLKFSTSTTQTLKQLLTQKDTAYMTGVTAIKEGFDDVNAHQMAVIAGMEAALQDILKRFNPEALEKRLESDSILDNILPGGKKAKYWEMFKILFDQIAGEAEDDFQQLFGSKFSRAYEQQLDRLKNNH